MKQVRFEFEELPYETLSQFGLTQEMIEDLPIHILEELLQQALACTSHQGKRW